MKIREAAYRSAHRKLWQWLAEDPGKGKEDWPGWILNGGAYSLVLALCFACEYMRGRAHCDSCPCLIDGMCCGGCFACWEIAQTPHTRRKYALLVRDAWPAPKPDDQNNE
jgi:hypothetical protein